MSMSVSGSSTAPILVPTTTAELIAQVQSDANDEAADAATQMRQMGRAERSEAQRAQIAQLRSAAEKDMIAGILTGASSIASGVAQVAGGLNGLGREGAAMGVGESEATHLRSLAESEGRLFTGSGQVVDGGLDIGAALLQRDATDARTSATRAEHRAEAASEVIQQAGDEHGAAQRGQDRLTQSLGEILKEQRRAEDAATRA